jgi:hypothetical protein
MRTGEFVEKFESIEPGSHEPDDERRDSRGSKFFPCARSEITKD